MKVIAHDDRATCCGTQPIDSGFGSLVTSSFKLILMDSLLGRCFIFFHEA